MATLFIILLVSVVCAVFALILSIVSIGFGYLIALMNSSLTIADTITASAVITTFIFYCFMKLYAVIKNGMEQMERDTEDDDDESTNTSDSKGGSPIYIVPSSLVPRAKGSSARKKRRLSDDSEE